MTDQQTQPQQDPPQGQHPLYQPQEPQLQPQPTDPPTTYGTPSQYVSAHWPPVHDAPPRKRKLKLGMVPVVLVSAGALAFGMFGGAFIGGASAGNKAPAVCLEALDKAGEAFEISADGFRYASDALDAASRFSVSGIRTATEGMEREGAKLKAVSPKYQSARDACQALK